MAADPTTLAAAGGFIFAHLPRPWLVPVVLLAAIAAAVWTWRRYGPPPGSPVVGVLARGARASAMALLVLFIAGPAWRVTATTVTPGSLVIAVDGSASMAQMDLAPVDSVSTTSSPARPRLAAAAEVLAGLQPLIDPAHTAVRWSLVCAGARDGDVDPAVIATLAEPASVQTIANGPASPIADSLDRLVARTRADALVVVTDGRITDGAGYAHLVEAWRGKGLRVAVLVTGTAAVVPDLVLDEIVINREAALNEREPVVVRLSHRGLPPGPLNVRLQVDDEEPQMVSAQQGATADPAVMATTEARSEVVFRKDGTAHLAVAVEAGGKRITQTVTVTVRERKLSVLLLDQRPRYEVRYLREAFKRDRTISLHAYLSEGRWRRWGNDGPDRLPLSATDLAGYDVVVIGDLGPDAFRAGDLANLEAAVRKGGTGLVWLPGETGATAGFAGQKLGELLPADLGDATTLSRGYLGPARQLSRTDTARRMGLLEPLIGAEAGAGAGAETAAETGSPAAVEWERLPRLLGGALIGLVKPGAEILAQDQDGKPLVVTRSFGVGRSVLIGVDDTWRWRRGVGDRFLHRFHSQLLRFAGANHRGDRRSWRLAATPRRTAPGEPLTVSLAPLRPDAEIPDKAVARLVPSGAAEKSAAAESTVATGERPDVAVTRREILVPLIRDGDGFSARLAAPAAGTWDVELAAGPDVKSVETSDLLVVPSGAERRDLRADRPALTAWAAAAGGTVTIHDSVADLLAQLPKDLRHAEQHTAVHGLWDTWWALVLIVALFAIDWSLRRANRLA